MTKFRAYAIEYAPLVIILLAALALRLIFFTGMVRGDDFNYAHAAFELSQGRLHLDAWIGSPRLALYAPVALLYFLFGPSEFTTLAYPVFCSLLSIVFVYGIARLNKDQGAGLLAAFLWAFLPLDIFLASDLIPDGPMAAFATGAVFFLVLAGKTASSRKYLYYGLSLFCLVWAIWIKPLAVVTLAYFFVHGVWRLWAWKGAQIRDWFSDWQAKRWPLPLVGIAAVIGILFYLQDQVFPFVPLIQNAVGDASALFLTGATEIDLSDTRIFQTDLLVVLTPLFLVSILVALTLRQQGTPQPLLWAAVLFLYYELGSVIPNPRVYRPILAFYEARNVLFVLTPFVVLAGIYLRSFFSVRQARVFLPVFAVILTIFAAIAKPVIEQGLIDNWLELSAGLAIVFTIASVVFVSRDRARATTLVGMALVVFTVVAMLKPAPPYHASYYSQRRENLGYLRVAVADLETEPMLLIYTNASLALNYASDFSLGYDWAGIGDEYLPDRVRNYRPDETIAEGLVVLFGGEQAIGENWQLLEKYGPDESAVRVYRIMGEE